MLYNVTPNFSLSAPPSPSGYVALPQVPALGGVGNGISGGVLNPSAAGAVATTGQSQSLVTAGGRRNFTGNGGGTTTPTATPPPVAFPNNDAQGGHGGARNPASNKPPAGDTSNVGSGWGWVDSAVNSGIKAGQTNRITDSLAPQIANTLANSEINPLINELNLQIGLNGQQYASQLVGFDASRQKALDDYNNAMAALQISERGRTDKRWLMDEMLKLQMRYYDRINQSIGDQSNAAQRQTPLIAAEKADNSRLYEIKAGELGRAKEGATDDNAMKQWELDQNAATGAGWQTKGYRIRTKTQTREYERTMANIEGDLETARINRDANDRNLTEKEAQVKDQLAQLFRDGAANEDKRVGDYLQYLYDVSELGRGAAEDNLRARQAQQTRDYQRTMIDSQQQQALVDRQRADSQLRNQQTQTQIDANKRAIDYLGTVKASLRSTGQDAQAQRFFDWFLSESTKKGASRDDALSYLASYVAAGNPLVIPANVQTGLSSTNRRTRGGGMRAE